MRRLLPGLLALTVAGACGRARPAQPSPFPLTPGWQASLTEPLHGPLASDGSRVFVATRDGMVRAFAVADGAPVWERERMPGQLAADAALVAVRAEDGTMLGLDPATGTLRWGASTGITGALPPVLEAGKILVAGDGMAALDAVSGQILWTAHDGGRASAPPTSFGPWVFVGEADGSLRCRDSATGATLWIQRTASALLAAPSVDPRRRLVLGTTDGRILQVKLPSGAKGWRWKIGADVRQAPVLAGDKVLVATYEDVLWALGAGNGHVRWRAALPSRPLASPILFDRLVLVACLERDLVAFELATGKRVGAFTAPADLASAPLLVGRRVVLGLRNRSLAAFDPAVPGATPSPSPSASPSPAN
jgi:outer membrane protein assembly factor BamB